MKPVHRLDEVCEVVMGQAPSGEAYNTDGKGWPLIAGAGDFGEGKPQAKKFTTEATKLSRNGDIILGIRASIGEKVFADGEYCLGRGVAALRALAPLESRFLWHWLDHSAPRLAAKAKGATFKQVNREDIGELEIELPPLAEQRRIADVLDRAAALRAKRRVALDHLNSLTQSIFLNTFGNPATNPKSWPRKSLFDLGKVVTGGTPPSAMAEMFDGPIPFVTPGDLESDEPVKRSLTAAGAEESRTVRAGAILVCCIGATIGKMGIAPVRSAFNQQLNAVEWFSEVDDLYGYATLRFFKPTIKSWGASTTLPILKKSSFEKIEIPVPPLPLQQEFARRFRATEKLRASQKASLTELDELFASLQNRAFKGEL